VTQASSHSTVTFRQVTYNPLRRERTGARMYDYLG
jgi:hypothetical protein